MLLNIVPWLASNLNLFQKWQCQLGSKYSEILNILSAASYVGARRRGGGQGVSVLAYNSVDPKSAVLICELSKRTKYNK